MIFLRNRGPYENMNDSEVIKLSGCVQVPFVTLVLFRNRFRSYKTSGSNDGMVDGK